MAKEYSSVLITGASSGIGAEIATHFASIGYKSIALVARRRDCLEKVKETCLQNGAEKVLILDRDLAKPSEVCQGIIEVVVAEFGGTYIH